MVFSKFCALAEVIIFASGVRAHGLVSGIIANGVYYEGYNPNFQYKAEQPKVVGWSIPKDQKIGFIDPTKYSNPDIICHIDATNGLASATVSAGSSIELQWTPWPPSHHGPVIDYLASCNGDCTKVDKTTLKFFKIDEDGLHDESVFPGKWASDTLIANNNSWTVRIPNDIAPGQYVLRHEIIALHSAQDPNGAQNYPQCINLDVTGSGAATPSGIPGESLYQPDEPGIKINIYTSLSTYSIPGPSLYSGAGSVGQPTPSGSGMATSTAGQSTTTPASMMTTSAVESPSVNYIKPSNVQSASTDQPLGETQAENKQLHNPNVASEVGLGPSGEKKCCNCKCKNKKPSEKPGELRRHARDLGVGQEGKAVSL